MRRGSEPSADTYPQRIFRHPQAVRVTVMLDGEAVEAFEGETLLAALLCERGWVLRSTERQGTPRGMFCGMGACMECLVHIEGVGIVRACAVIVRQGLVCSTLHPAEGTGYAMA